MNTMVSLSVILKKWQIHIVLSVFLITILIQILLLTPHYRASVTFILNTPKTSDSFSSITDIIGGNRTKHFSEDYVNDILLSKEFITTFLNNEKGPANNLDSLAIYSNELRQHVKYVKIEKENKLTPITKLIFEGPNKEIVEKLSADYLDFCNEKLLEQWNFKNAPNNTYIEKKLDSLNFEVAKTLKIVAQNADINQFNIYQAANLKKDEGVLKLQVLKELLPQYLKIKVVNDNSSIHPEYFFIKIDNSKPYQRPYSFVKIFAVSIGFVLLSIIAIHFDRFLEMWR